MGPLLARGSFYFKDFIKSSVCVNSAKFNNLFNFIIFLKNRLLSLFDLFLLLNFNLNELLKAYSLSELFLSKEIFKIIKIFTNY